MDCDLVLMATNIMTEINKIIGIKEGEYTTVLNVEDTTILSGIQYDKRVVSKDEEVKEVYGMLPVIQLKGVMALEKLIA